MASKLNIENLIQISRNNQQTKEIILLNILKMLINRNVIDQHNLLNYHEALIRNINQNDETVIPLNGDEILNLANELAVKFIPRKITTIKKVADIESFMEKPYYKIIIVSNIQKKAITQLLEYNNVEVFFDYELKINLIDNILIPTHRKLSPDEVIEVKKSYLLSDKDVKRIYYDDPVARYYKLCVGDFVEIKRLSINSGYAIDYRLVVDISIYK